MPGEGMDVCKCIVPSRHGGTLNIYQAKSHLVRLVEERWESPDHPQLLWRAPELVRDPNAPPAGTQKGDVYSFAIILYEIITRNGPYGQIDKTPSEIIKCVMRRDQNPPFRPRVSKLEDLFDCLVDCMQECWAEEPDERPDFKTIRTKLRPMRKGMKPNIFDNMLAMMEKYANNLEALVDERTDQLIEEKKKTDALLYEMLPKQEKGTCRRRSNLELYKLYKESGIVNFLKIQRIKWAGHVAKIDEDRTTKKVFINHPIGTRKKDRPILSWIDVL
ncbi:receptor-type guanylate cyclase Gyc76C [Trichonephila clavipes]|nr:receptor-type guanylate cyclase Gyc76C [Trichonephila clavipes]